MEIELKREDFINQYPPSNFLNKKDVSLLWEKQHYNLYVHIPFCYKKCEFCYYKSEELGDKPVPDEYVAALVREMEMYSRIPEIQSKVASSVYFGGGTPTKLSGNQIKILLDTINKNFYLDEDYELCFEARPGKETSEEKLALLNEYHIRRISFGVQSLDDEVLKANGRNHDVSSFYQVYELARKIGIPCINADLLSGMVNQTRESWLDTVDQLVRLRPENIAVYKLELYFNNVLYRKIREKEIKLMSNELEAEYVREGFQKMIDAGYIPVTNFSFASDLEYEHVHRKKLWQGEDMLGIGASAHSCMDRFIYQNEISVEKYVNAVEGNQSPIMRAYRMSKREEMIQRIVMGLKSMHFNRDAFQNEFGLDVMELYETEMKTLEQRKFLTIGEHEIALTLEGMLYADDIVRIFYLEQQKKVYLSHFKRT
ncbi:MAG: coproporphyrinogen-III oxidase family protein [Ruminiclostridium sp.]